jgi:flagellar hook-associated protein 2
MSSGTSSGVNLALSGLASGFNWQNLVNELAAAERSPETQMKAQITTLQKQESDYTAINSAMQTLDNDLTTLQDPTFFESATTSSSDTSVATAAAAKGAPIGNYSFDITQLATATEQVGVSHSGAALSSSGDVSSLVLSNAAFATPVTAGTFTVDGAQVTVNTTDTLQQVFDNISTATGGAVTASYDPTGDTIKLTSASPVVLGSANDTSNFLQSAKLSSNGGDTVTSSGFLGSMNLTGSLATANTATVISDGGSGNGEFTINGVAINFNATNDSISDVISRINSSTAGVTASYDQADDRLVLTNNTTGNLGMSIKDVTGNFLAATGLLGGTVQQGQNLLYTVNSGGPLTSQSNTISSASSGLANLTVTATGTGVTNIGVTSDTTTIQNAITSFVNDYNSTQSLLTSYTQTTTDSSGNETPGPLTGDATAQTMEQDLRQIANAFSSSLPSGTQGLADIGINSNGNDNTLAIDTATLTSALTNNLTSVSQLFSNPTNGVANTLGNYVDAVVGNPLKGVVGSMIDLQSSLSGQVTDINGQISSMETKVQADITRWTAEFVAMESAEAQTNEQLQYLNENFGSSATSSANATNLTNASNAISGSSSSSSSTDSTGSTGSTGSTSSTSSTG